MNCIVRSGFIVCLLFFISCTSVTSPGELASSKKLVKQKTSKVNARLVSEYSFSSTLINSDIKYHIYIPSAYKAETEKQYPVVYWLHGSGGFPPGVINILAKRFDMAIKNGKIPAMLVVFPDGFGQSMWLDSKDGMLPMEQIFLNELLPHIGDKYRTVSSAKGRMIEGGSMGGYGAARFGFKYPQLFGAISMLNPGPMQETLEVDNAPIVGRAGAKDVLDRVYGGDIEYFRAQSPWRLAEQNAEVLKEKDLKLRMIVGELDEITLSNQRFSEHLSELNISHDFRVLPGVGHSPGSLFPALGEDYWYFFKDFFEHEKDK